MVIRWAAFLGALAIAGCAADEAARAPATDEAVAARLAAALAQSLPSVSFSKDLERLDVGIYRPMAVELRGTMDEATCVKEAAVLRDTCIPLGLTADRCFAQSAWLDLHGTRACHLRLAATYAAGPPVLVIVDVPVPEEPPPAQCGNGVLEAGEECDDGNPAWWDGCAPTCFFEEFEGCETIIERHMLLAGVGSVPASGWWSPGAQLMVQPAASADGPVTSLSCELARDAADRSCDEIVQTMPFAGACRAESWHAPGRCTVRLAVAFARLAPDVGVHSTTLGGVLSFTLGR